MNNTIDTDRVCKLLGVLRPTVRLWITKGVIKIKEAGGGRGKKREFAPIEIFPVWIARGLLANNWTPEASTKVCVALQKYDNEDALEAAFTEGRAYIVAHNKNAHPELVTWDYLTGKEFTEAAREAGISPVVINVENAWKSLTDGLKRNRSEKPEAIEKRLKGIFQEASS